MQPPAEDRSRLTPPARRVVSAIKGAEILIDRFGGWPSFDDAEVISLRFDRGNLLRVFETEAWADAIHPELTAQFFVFNNRYASDSRDSKPSLITIRFFGIGRVRLDGFGHQNPIIGMRIRNRKSKGGSAGFEVDWGGTAIQHEAMFTCDSIEVLGAEDFAAAES